MISAFAEPWANGAAIQQQAQRALAQAEMPDTIGGWIQWALEQIATPNTLWVLVAMAVGLVSAIGGTEFAKRFRRLFTGSEWALKAQLFAAIWGMVVTSMLIVALTDWPITGRLVAILAVAPLAAFYPHKAYDAVRENFPSASRRLLGRIRGDHNLDASPP